MNLALIVALALWPLVAAAASLTGPGRIVDGDAFESLGRMSLAGGQLVKLWGIDAVEGSQLCQRQGQPWRCGDDAAAALRYLIEGRKLTCDAQGHDRYGRIVAVCRIEGRDIGAEMVRQGWALDYERYSRWRLRGRAGRGQDRAGRVMGGQSGHRA